MRYRSSHPQSHHRLHPDATSALVKEKMVKDGVESELFSLAGILGESSEGLLPMLLEAAKSDDHQLAEGAADR